MALYSHQHDPIQPEMWAVADRHTNRSSETVNSWRTSYVAAGYRKRNHQNTMLLPIGTAPRNFESICDLMETLIVLFVANIVRSLDTENPCVLMCQCENESDHPEISIGCQIVLSKPEFALELTRTFTAIASFSENTETALLAFVLDSQPIHLFTCNAPLKRSPTALSLPRELPA
ncbi:hypothetical protein BLNAU_2515 [Blattamonas nauphoetae]|uniref:Helix-turn-helix domain-containing protein n=1 Tax=Blattamonas nauphoetae TaxID=2049346 RepID=A0ABQ9YFZ4_9EUKA|nr:hypothetical protein BLNAU_2515 [Blattamonas nauphoetae]